MPKYNVFAEDAVKCNGEREIYAADFKKCNNCQSFSRAQEFNSKCGPDKCEANEILTE